MMTTNLLSIVFLNAAVSWLFTTNTVEHWPQKLGGMEPNPYYAKWLESKRGQNPYTLEYVAPELPVYVNDTNADSMSIETTVTCQRLLSFEFEKRKFSETLTNEPWMHYSVDMERVRTNASCLRYGPVTNTDGTVLRFNSWAEFIYPTNYFVPVKTNTLPLFAMENQPWMHGYTVTNGIGTNMFYILNNVITNYTVLWATTNATNTIK